MSTLTDERVEPADTDTDSIEHWWCCDSNVSLCGQGIAGDEEIEGDFDADFTPDDCAMCVDIILTEERTGVCTCPNPACDCHICESS